MSRDLSFLKSGTDVRGVALEGIAGQPVTLTGREATDIAAAFAQYLADDAGKRPEELMISIGQDPRLSSPDLAQAAVEGLTAQGCHVLDLGLCTTPAMFMTTLPGQLNCDGAIMVTASHLPYNRNGLKFFTRHGGLDGKAITDILSEASHIRLRRTAGVVDPIEYLPDYASLLTSKIRAATGQEQPLSGLRILVDAGNGSGGFFVTQVLQPLGADTVGSQFLEPDGRFPNHIPNPEDEEAMDAVRDAVLANHADLGIIFDTDCDRAAVVDASGQEINRNRLIALLADIYLREQPGATIVTDSVTSAGLAEFIAGRGGVHHRFKRGYRNVIDEAICLEEGGTAAPVAIETSGHCALKENYFLDDGAYVVTRLLIELAKLKAEGKRLGDLIEDLKEPEEAAELRLKILDKDFRKVGQEALEAVGKYAMQDEAWHLAPDNHEGVRVAFEGGEGDGWFLLRMSLHDPVMPLNIESDSPGGVAAIAAQLYPVLQDFDDLDLSPIVALL